MGQVKLLRFTMGGLLVGLVGCSGNPSSSDNQGGASSNGGASASGGATASSARGGASAKGGASSNGGATSSSTRGGAGTVGGAGGASSGGTSTAASGGTPASGGTSVNGGTSANGGAPTNGGSSKGGAAGTNGLGGTAGKGGSSGMATGGSSKGGASAGGASVGGASKGGATSGGAATGGAPKGGTNTGGSSTGGASGAATGGAATAGAGAVPAGNPDGHCTIPAAAQAENTATPTHVVGNGTAASCTGAEFVKQVALGGIITFNCGPDPITINVAQTAKIFNDTGPKIVIDGGGKVTLSGQDKVRILYQNTCDEAQHFTTTHCQDQDHPQLTVQNLTFVHGNAKNEADGGGAIFARGGRLKIVNSRFFNNVCADTGQDIGGGAVRAFDQSNGLPLYVVNSTFGGRSGLGNSGSNGGGVSSIGVSWTILNSLFSYNSAVGYGGNPAQSGTPGGGSGGAIYNDGNTMTLSICGTLIEQNTVRAFGGAIFFLSNDHSGSINITDSVIRSNTGGSWYPQYPGISEFEDTPTTVTNSTITN